jgi:hypothetical protein
MGCSLLLRSAPADQGARPRGSGGKRPAGVPSSRCVPSCPEPPEPGIQQPSRDQPAPAPPPLLLRTSGRGRRRAAQDQRPSSRAAARRMGTERPPAASHRVLPPTSGSAGARGPAASAGTALAVEERAHPQGQLPAAVRPQRQHRAADGRIDQRRRTVAISGAQERPDGAGRGGAESLRTARRCASAASGGALSAALSAACPPARRLRRPPSPPTP